MEQSGISLIDLGKLSEPASKLIDAVSNAIGVIYEPTRIRRKAAAEADAAIILAENRYDVREIEYRAAERIRKRETRRQQNIEAINEKAYEALPLSVSDELVNEDWVFDFFGQCQDVSSEQMQQLWGAILAGEVGRPGTFSLRTLATVKLLTPSDATLFKSLCTFVWNENTEGAIPIIRDWNHTVFTSNGLNFDGLLHLDALGLIAFNPIMSFKFRPVGNELSVEYSGVTYKASNFDMDAGLLVGHVAFTSIGRELNSIAESNPNEEYSKLVLESWQNDGLSISAVTDHQTPN
jgi:uncharacterized repeat protein (TIGR03899 family)